MLLQSQNPVALRDEIQRILVTNGLDRTCYSKILDYTIELFELNELGINHYIYHNIIHGLEVTYVTLLAAQWESLHGKFVKEDFPYLFVAALFHDYHPKMTADKPHEEEAVKFVITDEKLHSLLNDVGVDVNLIAALILRTTYPWTDQVRQIVEKKIDEYLFRSNITKSDDNKKEHFRSLGWFLSVADRIGGYALGNFAKAMEMAQKNAYAMYWHPYYIVRRSVSYFEDLLNNDSEMCQRILRSLPKEMRKNFMDNVLSFMKLREQEIQIEASFFYDNAKFVSTIELMPRRDPEFIKTLTQIHGELLLPLQFKKEEFAESVMDPHTILNTLRLGNQNGPIVGFAKGGPLEGYKLRQGINDPNYGISNTVFLEPIAIRMGYWGQRGGREIRLLFAMQAQAKGYKYLASIAQRDVISSRVQRGEQIEFTKQFNPERWDYYRIRLY